MVSAQNLLSNGDFNTPNTPGPNPAPTPWSTWAWPNWTSSWANQQNDASSLDGTDYMAVGNGNGTSYSVGFFQTVAATPGVA